MVFYQIFRSTSMRFLGWLSSVLGCWPWILLQFKNINFYYDLLSSLDSSCSVRYHKGSLPSRRSSCLVLPSIIAPTFTSIQLFRIELLKFKTMWWNQCMKISLAREVLVTIWWLSTLNKIIDPLMSKWVEHNIVCCFSLLCWSCFILSFQKSKEPIF